MKALKFLTTVMCVWFFVSWMEIAFHSPLESADYSDYNLIAQIFSCIA